MPSLITLVYGIMNYRLRLVHIGNIFLAKTPETATDYLLSLATLGDTTQHKKDPISSAAPPKVSKVTKTSSHVSLS
jgi:hypothetical protein